MVVYDCWITETSEKRSSKYLIVHENIVSERSSAICREPEPTLIALSGSCNF